MDYLKRFEDDDGLFFDNNLCLDGIVLNSQYKIKVPHASTKEIITYVLENYNPFRLINKNLPKGIVNMLWSALSTNIIPYSIPMGWKNIVNAEKQGKTSTAIGAFIGIGIALKYHIPFLVHTFMETHNSYLIAGGLVSFQLATIGNAVKHNVINGIYQQKLNTVKHKLTLDHTDDTNPLNLRDRAVKFIGMHSGPTWSEALIKSIENTYETYSPLVLPGNLTIYNPMHLISALHEIKDPIFTHFIERNETQNPFYRWLKDEVGDRFSADAVKYSHSGKVMARILTNALGITQRDYFEIEGKKPHFTEDFLPGDENSYQVCVNNSRYSSFMISNLDELEMSVYAMDKSLFNLQFSITDGEKISNIVQWLYEFDGNKYKHLARKMHNCDGDRFKIITKIAEYRVFEKNDNENVGISSAYILRKREKKV